MKKIVVVDDNAMLLDTVKHFIEGFIKDCKCVTFSNPEDALRYVLEEKEIYAVVTDYEMPQMNGLELAKKIIEQLPEMKVIVMSGHDEKYLSEKALRADIDVSQIDFVCKSNIINLIERLK